MDTVMYWNFEILLYWKNKVLLEMYWNWTFQYEFLPLAKVSVQNYIQYFSFAELVEPNNSKLFAKIKDLLKPIAIP